MSAAEFGGLPAALVKKLVDAGYLLRKPITEVRLNELMAAAGSLPEGVTRYLRTSDGLDHPSLFGVCGSQTMLKSYPSNSLLPLREDGCGDYDSVIIEPGPGYGAVVFWDHETTRAEYLLASSVPSYLELLVLAVPKSQRWSSDGQSQNEFVRAHDAAAARLLDDPTFQTLVGDEGRAFIVESLPLPGPGDPLPDGARVGVNPFTKERQIFVPGEKHRTPPKPR
jgi:hypothetical protein